VTTGIGAVMFTAKVEAGANVVVFGLGGIGLNVIQGAKMVGADKIIGVDLNPARSGMARKFGMTHFINPDTKRGGNVVDASCSSPTAAPTTASSASATPKSCARRWSARTRAGAAASSSAWPRRVRRSAPGRSSWSPGRKWEGLGLWRRARTHRRAEDRGLVHGWQDQHRRPDHPHHAAGDINKGLT
jgi:S-(hydroxymethyl)glutathione dehydrogenase/alcohol dehydrogenase